eukprot:Nitzschia sp. Nitz4//scaffold109_size72162//26470//27621//NITZ4_005844-RA/size72162-processed-gene-0.22-mRNA-1//1//CDS//3329532757//8176//frame0
MPPITRSSVASTVVLRSIGISSDPIPSTTKSSNKKATVLPKKRSTRKRASSNTLKPDATISETNVPEKISSSSSPKKKLSKEPSSLIKQDESSPSKRKKPRTSTASTNYSTEPPKDWESIYSLVEELRQDRTAPVDHHGSEALPQSCYGEKVYRFQLLVALMLSSQTKDAIVGETLRAMQAYRPPHRKEEVFSSYCYLSIPGILETTPEELNSLIRRVGFHNTKTKNILQVASILQDKYDGDIPPTAQLMMELPGIGPKMAFIIENVAFEKQSGIGIDTHMHRLFNQIGWVRNAKQPEQTRKQLEAWLPKDKWKDINLLWVGFGQEVQQQTVKVLRKALDCSRPHLALQLLRKVGVDVTRIGKEQGWTAEIQTIQKAAKSCSQ